MTTYLREEFKKRSLRITPEEGIALLKKDLPPSTEVEIDFTTDVDMNTRVQRMGFFLAERSYRFPDGFNYDDEMQVYPRSQQQGLGRILMRNEVEFASACGFQRMNTNTGLTAGAYVWARFGLLPSNTNEIERVQEETLDRSKTRALLTPREQNEVAALVRFPHAKSLWKISDLRMDIKPRLIPAFRAAKDSGTQKFIHRCLAETQNSPSLPLGRFLLAGHHWEGYIDFNDKEQMSRAEKYVGGWRTIPPVKI